MTYLLTYLMIAAGTLAFTAAILGRYEHGQTAVIEFAGWQRLLLALGGLSLLGVAIILYSYRRVMDGIW